MRSRRSSSSARRGAGCTRSASSSRALPSTIDDAGRRRPASRAGERRPAGRPAAGRHAAHGVRRRGQAAAPRRPRLPRAARLPSAGGRRWALLPLDGRRRALQPPSIDVAFTSAAEALGAGGDRRRAAPARTTTARAGCAGSSIAAGRRSCRSPATAEVRTMPEAGARAPGRRAGRALVVAPLDEIGPRIAALAVGLPAPAGRPTPPPAVVPPRTVRPTRRPR